MLEDLEMRRVERDVKVPAFEGTLHTRERGENVAGVARPRRKLSGSLAQ